MQWKNYQNSLDVKSFKTFKLKFNYNNGTVQLKSKLAGLFTIKLNSAVFVTNKILLVFFK